MAILWNDPREKQGVSVYKAVCLYSVTAVFLFQSHISYRCLSYKQIGRRGVSASPPLRVFYALSFDVSLFRSSYSKVISDTISSLIRRATVTMASSPNTERISSVSNVSATSAPLTDRLPSTVHARPVAILNKPRYLLPFLRSSSTRFAKQ